MKIIRIVFFAAAIAAVFVFLRPSVKQGEPEAVEAIENMAQEVEVSEPVLMTQQWVDAQNPSPERSPEEPDQLGKPDELGKPAKQDAPTTDEERDDAMLFEIDAMSNTPFD